MNKPNPHRARKRFGQNFLVDQGVIHQILRSIDPRSGERLVEIGPGQGALTEGLLASGAELHVVEIDRDLVPLLHKQFDGHSNLHIHQADALQFNFGQLADDAALRVVGNLPYNISTPLIFHLMHFRQCIGDMHFMLQREVVERMSASPGEKAWGRLGIMTQYYCEVEMLFDVPAHCFRPAPKVESAIVRLTPRRSQPWQATDVAQLDDLLKRVFQQRRKTLRNALRTWLTAEQLEQLNIDPGLRPENLSLADYVMLANFLSAAKEP